jgi:hypothetical protein
MGSEEADKATPSGTPSSKAAAAGRSDPWKYLVWIFEELPKVKVTAGTFASYTPQSLRGKLRPRQHAKRTA